MQRWPERSWPNGPPVGGLQLTADRLTVAKAPPGSCVRLMATAFTRVQLGPPDDRLPLADEQQQQPVEQRSVALGSSWDAANALQPRDTSALQAVRGGPLQRHATSLGWSHPQTQQSVASQRWSHQPQHQAREQQQGAPDEAEPAARPPSQHQADGATLDLCVELNPWQDRFDETRAGPSGQPPQQDARTQAGAPWDSQTTLPYGTHPASRGQTGAPPPCIASCQAPSNRPAAGTHGARGVSGASGPECSSQQVTQGSQQGTVPQDTVRMALHYARLLLTRWISLRSWTDSLT